MKTRIPFFIVVCCFAFLSCAEDKNLQPETGYIKANINGVETIYKTPPQNLDFDYNYIKPGAINLRFNKDKASSQYWSIDHSIIKSLWH